MFGVISETIRRVAKAPTKPKHCEEVVATVLVGLGLQQERIRYLMSMPLPDLELDLVSSG